MIVAENLSYTYTNAHRPAITNLHFEVRTGEILGFLGPNGGAWQTTRY